MHAEHTGLALGARCDDGRVGTRGRFTLRAAEASETGGETGGKSSRGRLARNGLTWGRRAILGGGTCGRRRGGRRLLGRLTRGEREPCRGQREGAKTHWT